MAPLTIVLLPGLDGTGDLFDSFVAVAPPDLKPLIIRMPPLGTYSELLEHIYPRLPVEGRFAVLGESFSGPLAISVARKERARVAAVILCNSFVSPPLTPLLRFLPWSLLFALPPPHWIVRHFLVGVTASRQLVTSVRAAVAKTPRAVLAGRMRSVFKLPSFSTSIPLDTPVLVLSSTQDILVRPSLHALQEVASIVVTKTIAGPHLLLQAAPQQAWSEISAFLAQAG